MLGWTKMLQQKEQRMITGNFFSNTLYKLKSTQLSIDNSNISTLLCPWDNEAIDWLQNNFFFTLFSFSSFQLYSKGGSCVSVCSFSSFSLRSSQTQWINLHDCLFVFPIFGESRLDLVNLAQTIHSPSVVELWALYYHYVRTQQSPQTTTRGCWDRWSQ